MSDKANVAVKKINWLGVGYLASLLGILIIGGAFGFAYFQLMKVNLVLANQVEELKMQVGADHRQLSDFEQTVSGFQQVMQQSQALTHQQEQVMSDWQAAQKNDLSRWHFAEAAYLIRMANDNAEYAGNLPAATFLLERASQLLQRSQMPAAAEVQQLVRADIARLNAVPQINTTNLYLKLLVLSQQLDQLPFPETPLGSSVKEIVPQENNPDLPWWRNALNQSWQALRQIIIVRQLTAETQPLVLPDEKIYLNLSLHAKFETAMWAVLHHDAAVYEASLTSMIAWIGQYHVQDAQITQAMLQQLQALRQIDIRRPSVRLTNVMQLLDNHFSQPEAS